MKKALSLILALIMVFTMAACAAPAEKADTPKEEPAVAADEKQTTEETDKEEPAAAETIRVGVLLPITGASAFSAALCVEGYDYCAEYWNNKGGIHSLNGAKIELVYADTQNSVDVAITEYERLISEEHVQLTTGPISSSVAAAIAPLAEKYKVPHVTNLAAAVNIQSQGYTYIFNPGIDSRTNALALAGLTEMVAEKFGDTIDGIAFLAENTEWGIQQQEDLSKYFEEAGIAVVFKETYETGMTDFSTIISKMKDAGAKFVVPTTTTFNDAVMLVRQLRDYKSGIAVLASGGCFVTQDFLDAVGDYGNYMFSTDCWSPGFLEKRGEEALKIHQGYVDKYGHNMGEYAGMSWIALTVAIAAIEDAGSSDPTVIRDALYNIDLSDDSEYMLLIPYERVTLNETTVDGQTNRNVYGKTLVSQVIDGKWTGVYPDELLVNNPIVWPIPEDK